MEQQLADPAAGWRVIEHPARYKVDGEVGRFEFATADVVNGRGQVLFQGYSLFPARSGKEWYRTAGFRELAFLLGATQLSHRKTQRGLNRSRQQVSGGTPLNTLRDGAEAEGVAVLKSLQQAQAAAFAAHGFDAAGTPGPEIQVRQVAATPPATLSPETVATAWLQVAQQMTRQGFTPEQIEVAKRVTKADYEDPLVTVHVHVDDVCVKKQKDHRNR